MPECFCGCGESIGLMQRDRKWANSAGAEAVRLIDEMDRIVKPWVEAGSPGFESVLERQQAGDLKQSIEDLFSEGEAFRDSCLALVHQSPGAEKPDRRAFKEWAGKVEPLPAIAQMPLENRRRFATAIVSGTGQEIFDAFEAGTGDR